VLDPEKEAAFKGGYKNEKKKINKCLVQEKKRKSKEKSAVCRGAKEKGVRTLQKPKGGELRLMSNLLGDVGIKGVYRSGGTSMVLQRGSSAVRWEVKTDVWRKAQPGHACPRTGTGRERTSKRKKEIFSSRDDKQKKTSDDSEGVFSKAAKPRCQEGSKYPRGGCGLGGRIVLMLCPPTVSHAMSLLFATKVKKPWVFKET